MKLYGGPGDDKNGCFSLKSKIDGKPLLCIVSIDLGWEHVSVSRNDKCPSWNEMEHIKRIFFKDDEAAFQLHVPVKEHKNLHPYVLHIWRPMCGIFPMPPSYMVA